MASLDVPPPETTSRRNTVGLIFQNGATQVGVMAGIVTMVSQPFAQDGVKTMLSLPGWFPISVALLVSSLLAVYQIRIVQRSAFGECCVLVPLMAVIVFATALGTNNLVANVRPGDPPANGAAPNQTLISNLEEQVKNEKRLREELLRALNLQPETEDASHAADTGASNSVSLTRPLADLLGLIVDDAYAGEIEPDSDRLRPDQIRQIKRALSAYNQKEEQLRDKERDLKRQEALQQRQEEQSLWKNW